MIKISGFDLSPIEGHWNFKALDIFSLETELEVKVLNCVYSEPGDENLFLFFLFLLFVQTFQMAEYIHVQMHKCTHTQSTIGINIFIEQYLSLKVFFCRWFHLSCF